MADFPVAHLKIQNVNVVVVFLSESFEHKPQAEKLEISGGLQICARAAGLAGNVVPVWLDAFGRMKFVRWPHGSRGRNGGIASPSAVTVEACLHRNSRSLPELTGCETGRPCCRVSPEFTRPISPQSGSHNYFQESFADSKPLTRQ
jgi:hypothetical protein